MTTHGWTLTVHTSDGQTVAYTLSTHSWDRATRWGHGIQLLSNCRPDELPKVLDTVADYILHEPVFQGDQDQLPGMG